MSLILSQEGACWILEATPPHPSPHLPDVVQELRGGEAVLGAGVLAAVVLEEGQQVGLQVKQPAGGGPCQPWVLAPASSTSPGCHSGSGGGPEVWL